MALSFRDPANLGQYQDIRDRIHVDEKWFFLTREKERYLLRHGEKPEMLCQA